MNARQKIVLTFLLMQGMSAAHAIPMETVFTFGSLADGQSTAVNLTVDGLTLTVRAESPYTGTDKVQIFNGGLGVAGAGPTAVGAAFGVQVDEILRISFSQDVTTVVASLRRTIDGFRFVCGSSTCSLFGGPLTDLQVVSLLVRWEATGVPEPDGFALLGIGLLAFGMFARRRRLATK